MFFNYNILADNNSKRAQESGDAFGRSCVLGNFLGGGMRFFRGDCWELP